MGSGTEDDQDHRSVTKHDVSDASTNEGTVTVSQEMTPNIMDGK